MGIAAYFYKLISTFLFFHPVFTQYERLLETKIPGFELLESSLSLNLLISLQVSEENRKMLSVPKVTYD